MLTTKNRRKRRTKLVRRRTGLRGKRKLLVRRRRMHIGRKSGHRIRYGRSRRKKTAVSPAQAKNSPAGITVQEPAVPLPVPPVHDPALFQQAYDEAYQEGFNSGFSKGFEDGHKISYKNRV